MNTETPLPSPRTKSKQRQATESALVLGIAVLAISTEAAAAVGIAREANGCSYESIADAITSSIPGDTLYVQQNTYPESGLVILHDLNIVSSNATCSAVGWTGAVIDGGGAQVMWILNQGLLPSVTLTHLTLRNGSASNGGVLAIENADVVLIGTSVTSGTATNDGGCVWIKNGSFTMHGGEISQCKASNGGAISAEGSVVDLYGSAVNASLASKRGGGMAVFGSLVTAHDDASIFGNVANEGGGISMHAGRVTLTDDSTVASNTAEQGGGVFTDSTAVVNLYDRSSIADNYAFGGTFTGQGGGLYLGCDGSGGGSCLVHMHNDSTVRGNTSEASGGGVAVLGDAARLEMDRGTAIEGNTAAGAGGGVWVAQEGTLSATGASISNNHADGSGGGIEFTTGDTHTLLDTLVRLNTAGSDGGGMSIGQTAIVTMDVVLDGPCNPNNLAPDRYCSEVIGNGAGRGGGAYVDGVLNVQRTAFLGNSGAPGGAVFVDASSALDVQNSLFALNDANPNSAALHIDGQAIGRHVTITANTTRGARFSPGSIGGFEDSILWGNLFEDLRIGSSFVAGSCTTIGSISGSGAWNGPLIIASPMFVTTPRGAFRPGPLSPVLNVCPLDPDVDLDLRARTSAQDDMGAFER